MRLFTVPLVGVLLLFLCFFNGVRCAYGMEGWGGAEWSGVEWVRAAEMHAQSAKEARERAHTPEQSC